MPNIPLFVLVLLLSTCERCPSVSLNILGFLLSVKVSKLKFILVWAVNLSFYPAGLLNWAKMSFMYVFKYEIALCFLIYQREFLQIPTKLCDLEAFFGAPQTSFDIKNHETSLAAQFVF